MAAQQCKTIICSRLALNPDDPVRGTVEAILDVSQTADVDDVWRANANDKLDQLLLDRATLSGKALTAAEAAFVQTAKTDLFEPLFP